MRTITLLLLLSAPALAFAQTSADEVSYHYLSLGLSKVNYDVPGPNLEGSGLSLEYSVEARKHIHLFAAYDAFDFDDAGSADGDRRAFGVGTQFAPAQRFSIYGRVGYLDQDIDVGAGNVDDDGGLLEAGLRYEIGQGWEIRGAAQQVFLDKAGNDTYFKIGGDLRLTDAIALSLDANDRDGSTAVVLGLRFYFDKQNDPQ
ncbi:MAG TPA: outer membrane beta-barrel protein [Gammaproteobacteria bacterium]|nr:outer membrane beta-barrel protein [Gammaproteobacteria bacterium]